MHDFYPFIRQIAQFSTTAKVTQARYGASNPPAHFDRDQKSNMVARIASQSSSISKAARSGRRNPKKSTDQRLFSAS